MNIVDVPFTAVDWSKIPATEHAGITGKAIWRTFEQGNIRARMVEYTPGYAADHWCSRGHVLSVLEGTLVTELKDGSRHTMTAGMCYIVADDTHPHRSSTECGAKLFIVD